MTHQKTVRRQAQAVVDGLAGVITQCPFCGGRIELSVKQDCHIDADGSVVSSRTGGMFEIYCENNCSQWTDRTDCDLDEGEWPSVEDIQDRIKEIMEDNE